MLKTLRFENYRVLRNATLPLAPFTLLVGPNGCGKSTVINSLQSLKRWNQQNPEEILSALQRLDPNVSVSVVAEWDHVPARSTFAWRRTPNGWGQSTLHQDSNRAEQLRHDIRDSLDRWIHGIRLHRFDPPVLRQPAQIVPSPALGVGGENLPAVLEALRDRSPEEFDRLAFEFRRLIPEFERIALVTTDGGTKSIAFKTASGTLIPSQSASDGTLVALALLTLAYLPVPPTLLCIEEPDHGIHPRLLREVIDALHRLSYPSNGRDPIQIVATTHSPHMLNFFSDHPEEVLIAKKNGLEAEYVRLSDMPDIREIVGESGLGDAWYTGILGGVPAKT